jgi:hypothetical protein
MFALAALAALAYSAFTSAPVKAQETGTGIPIAHIKSAGPISLHDGESALIGLLLPAVQRTGEPYRLRLFDGDGSTLITIPVNGERSDSAPVITAYFDVFFADGSVRVVDHATGKVLLEPHASGGSFSAVLLPAVQRNGQQHSAISASVQIFNADHMRGEIVGMCDGSV